MNQARDFAKQLGLDDDAISELGLKLCMFLDVGVTAREHLKDRWSVNEQYYRNQPDTPVLPENTSGRIRGGQVEGDWRSSFHAPLMQPIIDTLVAQLTSSVVNQDTYAVCRIPNADQEVIEAISDSMQCLLESAHFAKVVRQAALISALVGTAFVRVHSDVVVEDFLPLTPDVGISQPKTGETLSYAGLVFTILHPRDVAVYPESAQSISQAKMIAHRGELVRRTEAKELMDAGRWIDYDDVLASGRPRPTEPQQETDMRGSDDSRYVHPDDGVLECWTGLCKLKLGKDKVERYYEFVVNRPDRKLLLIKPYPLSKPWYSALHIKDEYLELFTKGSVAQDLQGLQSLYNECMNEMADGTLATTAPIFFAQDGALVDPKMAIEPGLVVTCENVEGIKPYAIEFNPSGLLAAMQYVEQMATKVARISQNSQASEISQNSTTATEASLIAAADANTFSNYLEVFSLGLSDVFSTCQQLMAHDWEFFKMFYGDWLGEFDPAELNRPIRWDIRGQVSRQTDAQIVAQAQALLALDVQMAQATGAPVYDTRKLLEFIGRKSGIENIETMEVEDAEDGAGLGDIQGMVPQEAGNLQYQPGGAEFG